MVTVAATHPANWVELIRALAWPFAVVALALIVVASRTLRSWLVDLARRIRKVSGFGVDVELTAEVSTQVRELTQDAFRAFRKRVIAEFDTQVHVQGIVEKRNRMVDAYIMPILHKHGVNYGFRCTVHVPDVLFTETLYQLLDYYPPSDGPRGRTFSVRYGIIGKAWRTGQFEIDSAIPTDPEQLIRDWGMTREEAVAGGHGRSSLASIVVHDSDGVRVAVVYLDVKQEGAFGKDGASKQELADAVRTGSDAVHLTTAIASMMANLRGRSPLIPLYDVGGSG
jgi:hypothetical protein